MNVEDAYMKFERFSAACRRLFRAGILSRSVVLGLLTMWTLQSTGGPPYNEGRALRGSLPALSKEQKPDGKVLIDPRPKVQARLAEAYGSLPLSFEPNDGQAERKVKFLSRGSGYTLFLTSDEAVLALRSRQSSVVSSQLQKTPGHGLRTTDTLRMKLVGANRAAKVTALEELPGKSNYFIGNDPRRWRTDVPTYAKVKYAGVYPGIDLIYYGNQRQLEYDFVVAAGADPKAIQLAVVGAGLAPPDSRQGAGAQQAARAQQAAPLRIDGNGDLVVETDSGEVRFHKPVVYQEESGVRSQESEEEQGATDKADRQSPIGNRKLLDGRYVLTADNQVRFEVPGYDKTKP